MKKRNVNLRTKLVISYVLVMLLPMAVILFYYYPFSKAAALQREVNWNTHITEQAMNSMEIFTRYVYNLPNEIVRNREISLLLDKDDAYTRSLIANEMKKYNATDAFTLNTFLYLKKGEFFFSRTGGAYSIEDFNTSGSGYIYEKWDHGDMIRELNTLSVPKVRSMEPVVMANTRMQIITFLLPLLPGSNNGPGAVMIMVQADTVASMVKSISEKYQGHFLILDKTKQPIFTSNPEIADLAMAGRVISRTDNNGINRFELQGEHYLVSKTVSKLNGWTYISLLPLAGLEQETNKIGHNTLIIVGIVLALEIGVILLSIRLQLSPIQALVRFASTLLVPKDSRKMSEIEVIRYALDHLTHASRTADDAASYSADRMREGILRDLLEGRYIETDDYETDASAYGIALSFPHISVAVLSSESDGGWLYEFVRQSEGFIPKEMNGYAVRTGGDDIVLIASMLDPNRFTSFLEELWTTAETDHGRRLFIGIGESGGISDVPNSYLQALRTVDHLRVIDMHAVMKYNMSKLTRNGSVPYPVDLVQSLEMYITMKDASNTLSTVEKLISFIRSSKTPPHMIRSVYLNAISVILSGLQHHMKDDHQLNRLMAVALNNRFTMNQMADILRDSAVRLHTLIEVKSSSPKPDSIMEVLAYIEAEGYRCDFSLQMASERFGMSPSNFSHYFKKATSQNFKDYLDQKRIQKTKYLLEHTDENLNQISLQVGYFNTSSFIRSFKKQTGMTPGQYRESRR